jgi:sarcosine oxidase, subunit delta
MMQLKCPWCGMRDESEFVWGGTTHLTRPPLTASDAEWAEYLFFRDNPRGVHLERWRHTYGCGQWFNLARHTVTHEVSAVYAMTEPPPGSG